MSRTPPNVPERGDRCQLRGRPQFVGTLRKYDPELQWAKVEWDDGNGPKVCHRFELERVAQGNHIPLHLDDGTYAGTIVLDTERRAEGEK